MERRKIARRDWVVGRDDTGHSVLEWKVENRRTRTPDADPCARTYDFLEQLEVPDLVLEDEAKVRARRAKGLNPYDTGRLLVSEKIRE
jgi:hypothetical protein